MPQFFSIQKWQNQYAKFEGKHGLKVELYFWKMNLGHGDMDLHGSLEYSL